MTVTLLIVFYLLLLPLLVIGVGYAGYVWWQVRGFSGLVLLVLSLSLLVGVFASVQMGSCSEFITDRTAALFSCQTALSIQALAWIRSVTLIVEAVCVLLLIDLYAARFNRHRALTTILYTWWIRITEERPRSRRSEARAQEQRNTT